MASDDENGTYAATAAAGRAPWLREGVNVPFAPDAPEARRLQDRLQRRVQNAEAQQRRPAEQDARQLEEDRVQALEQVARRFFVLGCLALPWVHAIMWSFFWREWKDPSASAVIKKYLKMALIVALLWTAAAAAWFIVFQVMPERFKSLDVLSIENTYF